MEDLLVNLCFTKLKELKLTNGIDKKSKKDNNNNNNNKTQRKNRILPLECFEEENSGMPVLNDAHLKVQSLQPKHQMSDSFVSLATLTVRKLKDADVFSGGRPANLHYHSKKP